MENETIKELREKLETIANKVISNEIKLSYLDSINLQSIVNLANDIKEIY